jgi:hypothetical protein
MTASASIEMTGLKEAIRSLNKVEPGLRKEFTSQRQRNCSNQQFKKCRTATTKYLSGMSRNWSQGGNKKFPFTVAKQSKV